MDDITTILPEIIDTARTAGVAIMGYYKTGSIIYKKEDSTPVTEADREADKIISERLKSLANFPVVSEEGEKPDISNTECFWLVDPLDGTKSFIRSSGYFTVNIGLIKNKTPVLGVIYDPANRVMYYGSSKGAFREHNGVTETIHIRPKQAPMTALVSHSHINEATKNYLAERQISKNIPCASSIKFCFLAEGQADIYPRFGETMEWDTAAGHAILLAAGGAVNTPQGTPLLYGKQGFLNGHFIASN